MASLNVDVAIDTAKTAQSIGELRKGLKDLISAQGQVADAGSEQFKKLQKAINETEGKMGDLTDSFKTLRGSGVERINASLGLFREGLMNADTGQLTQGLGGLKAAMSAVPIFLFVEGIKLIIDNFDKVIELFKEFTGEAQKNAKALTVLSRAYTDVSYNLDEIEERQESLGKTIDRNTKLAIEAAKQRGASAQELAKIEIDGNAEKIKVLLKAEENYLAQRNYINGKYDQALINGDEETIKEAKAINDRANAAYLKSRSDRRDAETGLEIQQAQLKTSYYEKEKEANKKLQKDLADQYAIYLKTLADLDAAAAKEKEKKRLEAEQLSLESTQREFDLLSKNTEDRLAATRLESEDKKNSVAERLELLDYLYEQEREKAITAGETTHVIDKQYADKKDALNEESKQKAIANEKVIAANRKQITDQSLNAARGLSNAFFAYQLNKAKGNAAAEDKLKRQQFELDKKISVAKAIIDGVRAVQAALTIPPPVGTALAVLNGVVAAANVITIANTQYDSGASGAGAAPPATPSAATSDAGGSTAAPTSGFSAPDISSNGNKTSVQTDIERARQQKVYVLESDIRDAMHNVDQFNGRATFGG